MKQSFEKELKKEIYQRIKEQMIQSMHEHADSIASARNTNEADIFEASSETYRDIANIINAEIKRRFGK